jgi:hypothetical protein
MTVETPAEDLKTWQDQATNIIDRAPTLGWFRLLLAPLPAKEAATPTELHSTHT